MVDGLFFRKLQIHAGAFPAVDLDLFLDLGHGFHEVPYLPSNDNLRYTISEPARLEILSRLSSLNRLRWEEEEKAGLHKKKKQ